MTQPSNKRLLVESQAATAADDVPSAPSSTPSAGSSPQFMREDAMLPSAGLYAYYGDGSDGDVLLDGVTDYTGLQRTGSVYVAQQTLNANDLTILGGVTLRPSGQHINVLGILSGAGSITADTGKTAATGTGAGFTTLLAGGVGAAGGTGVGAGGVSPSNNTSTNATSGAGGASGTGNAGGGSASPSGAFVTGGRLAKRLREALTAFTGWVSTSDWGQATPSASFNLLAGGCSGGAGGGDGTNAGGKGGNGGQVVIVNARRITGSLNLSAPAENGGAAAGGNAGGGGGGAGGAVILNTTSTTGWTGALSAPGGTGGAKAGTGVVGNAGGAGVTQLNVWS